MSEGKPERYVVYWPDYDRCALLATERECSSQDIDPSDYEESRDFNTLEDARIFLNASATAWDGTPSTVAGVGGRIEERTNLRRAGGDGFWWWDWDQACVDDV